MAAATPAAARKGLFRFEEAGDGMKAESQKARKQKVEETNMLMNCALFCFLAFCFLPLRAEG